MLLRIKLLRRSLLSLAFLCAAAACHAQDFFPSEYPAQARLSNRAARDAGTDSYYLDFFLPVYLEQDSILRGNRELLVFINPKLVSTSYSQDEENLGAGVRYLSAEAFSDEGFICGANIFYDSKYSVNGIRHYQLGLGFEFLTPGIDVRANAYQPLSGTKAVFTEYSFGQYSLDKQYKEEEPLPGFDAEAGFLVPIVSDVMETRLLGGGYWYASDIGRDISGRKARLEISPHPALTLTLELRDDTIFGNDMFAGCRVNIPFDIGRAAEAKNPLKGWGKYLGTRNGRPSLQQRLTDPIVRDIDIVTVDKSTSEKLQDIVFVNNTNDADPLEDGSASHPHNTLAEAFSNPAYGEGVWIYVRQGDGTADGYTGEYTLAGRCTLWGEGYRYLGLGGQGYPLIKTNDVAADTAITLGQDNTVMGVKIQNARYGIAGDNFGTVDIHDNIIADLGASGASGQSVTLTTNNGTASTALITHNTFTGNIGNGIDIAAENFSTCSATISGNTISNQSVNGLGIVMTSGGVLNDTSSIDAILSDNTITNNTSSGLSIHTNFSSHISARVERNTITGNGQYGIYIDDVGTSSITLDAGNGSLGSGGHNSIYGNTSYHINNNTADTVVAENNWWGKSTPEGFKFRGSVDRDPWLTTAPE